MRKARCPICGFDVELDDNVVEGELIDHDCGVTLEVVVEGDNLSLKPFEGVGEDWGE